MSNTYAIASAKGGVGKTTTVANLGAALAAAGEDVAVVDADIGMANLADTLGIDPDGATLHDVLAGTTALEDALYEGADGLTVLPGSAELEDYRTADLDGLADVLATLVEDHEYVLVDTGAGLSHDAVLPLEVVDEVVLVSTPQPQALGDTEKTRGLVERLGGSVAGLVLTRAGTEATADPVEADVVGRIPDDPAIDEAVIAGEPVVSFAAASPAADAYRTLVAELFGVDVAAPEGEAEPAGATAAPESATDAGALDEETGAVETEDAADHANRSVVTAEATGGDAETVGDDSADASSAATDADVDGEAEPDSDAAADTASADDPEEEAESDTDVETGASETAASDSASEASEVEADASDVETDASEAEDDKPASVGPHRTEDVPVSEAEPGAGSPDIDASLDEEGAEESDAESTPASNAESKGFFSRLLGR